MQRKAYASGLVATLLALLATGCTADDDGDGTAMDSKAGKGVKQPVAQPGKYRTLLEPCGSVGSSTLKDLLPVAAGLSDDQRQRALRGTPASTYDTDRRVGCGWAADAPDASHAFSVDFERVVSYDDAVGDDDRAQEVFSRKQVAAGLPPAVPPTGSSSTTTTPPSGPASPRTSASGTRAPAGTGAAAGTGTGTVAGGTASGSSTSTPEGLEPRVLDDLGDAAFLDDTLTPTSAGSTAQRRTVSVVFRTSNVIVTIVYVKQPTRTAEVPDSKELQERAQSVARSLVDRFSE
ncbi:DUF3558 domain-containing protein [Streptomyces sp. NPDC051018]|uniref:DUF3558 domain-containing protein n=1 Tax=Streptomyces sp. NPDC051018 TaxID=3365639 RepID=UPI0037B3F9FD